MGFHTFAASEVLTAANVMTYLMNQAVIACTSTTRPGSPVAGMCIYETDTNRLKVYDGSGWKGVRVPEIVLGDDGSLTVTPNAAQAAPSLAITAGAVGQPVVRLRPFAGGTDILRAQDSAGSVTNLAIDVNAHLSGLGTAPTGAAGANAGGTPPSPVVSGSDQAGSVTFGTGTTPAAGAMVVVTFNRAWTTTPRLVLTAVNSATALLGQPYVSSPSGTGFTINVPNAAAASQGNTIYGYRWVCA